MSVIVLNKVINFEIGLTPPLCTVNIKNDKWVKTIVLNIVWLVLLFPATSGYSQTINGYASVNSIAGSVLTISNVDESSGTFEDGDELIIIQIQDSVIGSNILNDSDFGKLGVISSAGLYEVATISSHIEVAGTPTSITLSGSLTNTYNLNNNSSVQIITFPELGSPNYVSGNISAKNWDGTTGGVVAFQVSGKLTIGGEYIC